LPEVTLSEKQIVRVESFIVSRAEIKLDLRRKTTQEKALASKIIQSRLGRIKVLSGQGVGAGKAQSITQHTKLLSLDLIALSNFLTSLAQGQKVSPLTGLIRSDITSLEMLGGRQSKSRHQTECPEITG
jgi:hypothetical protein